LLAVARSGRALRFVKKQTPEICRRAIQCDAAALSYVKKQTPSLCLLAVTNKWHSLQYVKKQTPKICMTAVQQSGSALRYVHKENQTKELCEIAVRSRPAIAPKYVLIDEWEFYIPILRQHPATWARGGHPRQMSGYICEFIVAISEGLPPYARFDELLDMLPSRRLPQVTNAKGRRIDVGRKVVVGECRSVIR
jgi:hypothetical protein